MQRGFGDSARGGDEGQEDGGPSDFQSLVPEWDDLISWDGDLSAGGPSDGIPPVTEGGDKSCRVQPSIEAERPSSAALRGDA